MEHSLGVTQTPAVVMEFHLHAHIDILSEHTKNRYAGIHTKNIQRKYMFTMYHNLLFSYITLQSLKLKIFIVH